MADKPLTAFLNNVVRNGAVTLDQAQALNQLATPHLQFDAVLRLRRDPQQSVDALIKEVLENPDPSDDSPPQANPAAPNRRWVNITVLAVAMPLVYGLAEAIHLLMDLNVPYR